MVARVVRWALAAAALAALPAAPAHAAHVPIPEGGARCPDALIGAVSVKRIYVVNTDCATVRTLAFESAYASDPPEGWTCDGHSGVFFRWRYHLNVQCTSGDRYAHWAVFAYPDALMPFSRPLYIVANSLGLLRLSVSMTPRNASVDRVYTAFGQPYRVVGRGGVCRATWPDLGLLVYLVNLGVGGCEEGSAQEAQVSGPRAGRWRTNKGLRVGDTLSRLRRLYPRATRHGRRWWLVRGILPFGDNRPYGVVSAEVQRGRVASLHMWIGAAGE